MTQRRKRQLEIVALLTILLLSSAPLSFAGSGDENWDGHFGVPGPDGYGVGAILTTENGVYVGGSFISINGVVATNIAQFDGKSWLPLGSGLGRPIVDGPIALTYCQGWLYAAGTFTNAGTQPALNVARWDGTNWCPSAPAFRGLCRLLPPMGLTCL